MEPDSGRKRIELRLDESQLMQVSSALAPSKASGFNAENALRILQSLAIIGAALWALHEYVRFGKTNEALTLKNAELATQLNGIDLANKQRFDELRNQLTISQQRLSLDQSKLAIDVAKLGLMTGKKELLFKTIGRLKVDDELTLERRKVNAPPFYVAHLNYRLTNLSQGEITILKLQIIGYIGKPSRGERYRAPIMKVNYPGDEGAIDWLAISREAYLCADCGQSWSRDRSLLGTQIVYGGAVGRILQGESTVFEYDYVVDTAEDQYVGFIVYITTKDNAVPWRYRVEPQKKCPHRTTLEMSP